MYAHIGYVGTFLLPIENDPSAWAHTDPCRAPIDGSGAPLIAACDHDWKALARKPLQCKPRDLGADQRARSGTLTRNSLVPAPADDRGLEIHPARAAAPAAVISYAADIRSTLTD
jgi:hypothetical protein